MNRRRFLYSFGSGCLLAATGCATTQKKSEPNHMIRGEATEIAACGLDCGACAIRRMPFDDEAAAEVVAWFKNQGWLKEDEGVVEALERSMYCKGCHGDRSIHWDAECWILRCCVDDRGLNHCSECEAFPCDALHDWSTQRSAYGEALQRLRTMHDDLGT
jgi:hypothetical protein